MNLIRPTKRICPVYYRVIDADVHEENGAVWMSKRCAEHGPITALFRSDSRLYPQFEANDIAGALSGERHSTLPTWVLTPDTRRAQGAVEPPMSERAVKKP